MNGMSAINSHSGLAGMMTSPTVLIYDNLLFLEVRLEMRRITTARIVNSSPH
jgi:hypothetical protein